MKPFRDQLLDRVRAANIFNIRIGINIHEFDFNDPRSLDAILDFHREAWKRGISITDSILYFSSLKKLETLLGNGEVDPTKSAQNNPQFPAYAERIARFVLTAVFDEQAKFNRENSLRPLGHRLPPAHTAINPVNEPETFADFDRLRLESFERMRGRFEAAKQRGDTNVVEAAILN